MHLKVFPDGQYLTYESKRQVLRAGEQIDAEVGQIGAAGD
jgi:hypothetical protein